MEHEAPTMNERRPADYEAKVQGYESWYDSELIECAKRCLAELDRRGVLQRTKIGFRERLRILFRG